MARYAKVILYAPWKLTGWVLGWIVKHTIKNNDHYRMVSLWIARYSLPFGNAIRYSFYKQTLRSLGRDVNILPGVVIEGRQCSIGSNVYIGYRTVIFNNICIGNNVRIAHNANILSGGRQHVLRHDGSVEIGENPECVNVSIGDNTWIGCCAVVMASVGARSIVGAGAIVTKPVPDDSIAVGNPARSKALKA